MSSYEGITYVSTNSGIKPKELKEETLARLKTQFDYNKAAKTGTMKISNMVRIIKEAKIEQSQAEQERMLKLAALTSDDGSSIGYNQMVTLVANKVDVNMLMKLFNDANTDKSTEKVEFFLDLNEMMALLQKLDISIPKEEFEKQLDALDKDSDGKVDWEEFLTVSGNLMGSFISIDKADPDGTSFNQLRDATKDMEENMKNTNDILKELDEQIQEKKADIEKKIKDTTLQDIRKKLKKEWDDKDRMEMALLDMKMKHFNEMKDMLLENDQEKMDLVDKYNLALRTRDQHRNQIDRVRNKFENGFKNNFVTVEEVMAILQEIELSAKGVQEGLETAQASSALARKSWAEQRKMEKAPEVSKCDAALDYLNKQTSVMSEITTKMQMMQRERDKHEEMIAEEMEKNKEKRIECVNLNMKITNYETKQMAMESKLKDVTIQNQTLEVALEKKLKDTDSKKVKQLKNTLFQFEEEKRTVDEQVEDAKAKLKKTIKLLAQAKTKAAQLNIELGELKIILEGMKNVQIGVKQDQNMPAL